MKKLFLLSVFLFGTVAMGWAQMDPSYIAVEVNSGKVLYSTNAEAKRPIASLAQVATALVALDWANRTSAELNTVITIPQDAYAVTSVGNPMRLKPGDRITLRDALYSCLLGADNVSALTVASYVGRDLVYRRGGGSPIGQFIKEMNNLATGIGMKKTVFVSPHGMDSRSGANESCAVDLALLGSYAMQNPAFSFIVRQSSRRIGVETATEGTQYYNVVNTNSLLNQSGVDGIKTGSSRVAGPCLLLSAIRQSVARKDAKTGRDNIYPQRLVIVVLGTEQRFSIARSLIREGWRDWDRWQTNGMQTTSIKDYLKMPTASPNKK
ncbi:MAG: serine hydrolase [Akkermansia sp.]